MSASKESVFERERGVSCRPRMLPILALLLGQLPDVQQPPRLRTILPNGATILVERVPGASRVWTRLFLSARGADETPVTHGLRHLLEHLVATGRDGTLDARLEKEGAFLTPQTLRDATEFDCDAPAGKLDLALGALGEMLSLRSLQAGDIAREAGIVRQEGALMEPSGRFAAAAWRVAYGDAGLAPFGDLDIIRAAAPGTLAALHRRLCVGPNLVVVVAGDVDLDKATAAAAGIVRAAPKQEGSFALRPAGKGGEGEGDAYGEARALPVPSYDEPRTVAALAAALAIGSELDDAFVTYTPSRRPGLVVLGRTGEETGLDARVAAADPAALWGRGKLLVAGWLRRQTGDPGANASLRGLLLAQSVDAAPDRMRDAVSALTYGQFAAAVDAFKGPGAVRVRGK